MKVILATDSIFWPLTGIGKYTFELAKRYSSDNRLSDIRFFNMGHWQTVNEFQQFGEESTGELKKSNLLGRGFGFLRKTLAASKPAVKVYSTLTPLLYQHRLKPYSADYIYHSPNFMLPAFSGKKVVTFHDLSIFKFPEFHPSTRVSFLKTEMLKAAQLADHIITDSEIVRQEVVEYFSRAAEDVTAIPLASSLGSEPCDASVLNALLKRHGLIREQFFLFVSSIEPRKNIGRVLDAYEALPMAFKRRHPLVLAGSSGWKSEDIFDRIRLLNQDGLVHYLGYTTDAELECLYSSAGALLFPSVYEGFGLPIVEAQTFGLPVITSDISCMPEVAGGAAMLVDPYDVKAISDALEKIMSDVETRQELKAKGYKNAMTYSWDRTVAMTLDVYAGL